MVIAVAVEVHCTNRSCGYVVRNKRPRFIGEDYGRGGRWQCRQCGEFTVRGVLPSGGDVT